MQLTDSPQVDSENRVPDSERQDETKEIKAKHWTWSSVERSSFTKTRNSYGEAAERREDNERLWANFTVCSCCRIIYALATEEMSKV